MENNFILVLIGSVIIWFLYSILKELRWIKGACNRIDGIVTMSKKEKQEYDLDVDGRENKY